MFNKELFLGEIEVTIHLTVLPLQPADPVGLRIEVPLPARGHLLHGLVHGLLGAACLATIKRVRPTAAPAVELNLPAGQGLQRLDRPPDVLLPVPFLRDHPLVKVAFTGNEELSAPQTRTHLSALRERGDVKGHRTHLHAVTEDGV